MRGAGNEFDPARGAAGICTPGSERKCCSATRKGVAVAKRRLLCRVCVFSISVCKFCNVSCLCALCCARAGPII